MATPAITQKMLAVAELALDKARHYVDKDAPEKAKVFLEIAERAGSISEDSRVEPMSADALREKLIEQVDQMTTPMATAFWKSQGFPTHPAVDELSMSDLVRVTNEAEHLLSEEEE